MCLIWKIWTSCGKSFCRIGRTIIYVSAKTYSKNFFEISDCQKIRKMSSYTFWRLAKVFLAGHTKMRFLCPEKCFDEKQAFVTKFFSKAFSEPERKTVRLWNNFFEMVIESAFYISTKSFWIDCMFFKVWNIFLHKIRWTLTAFSQKFRQGRKNYMLRHQRSILRRFFLKRKNCFITSGPWMEKLAPPGEQLSTTLRML